MEIRRLVASAGLAMFMASSASAGIVYDSWTSNDGDSANYIFSVEHVGNTFEYNLNIDPWNAEALGLFIDLGGVDLGDVLLSSVNPFGEVSLFAKDTTSNSCGAGCNLNGLNPSLEAPDGQWELVFRLGSQGWDEIQSFSWVTNDFGLTLADFGTVGIRSQQLCSDGYTLPDNIEYCEGSDKSYGSSTTVSVPEPSPMLLLALGLLGLGLSRRNN